MTHDHALRLITAWATFLAGLLILVVSYIPSHWPTRTTLGMVGALALILVTTFDRTKPFRRLYDRAPSGRVEPHKTLFIVGFCVAIIPALTGAALLYQQTLGHAPRTLPNILLAPFSLYPLAIAYFLLGSGRVGKRTRRGNGP